MPVIIIPEIPIKDIDLGCEQMYQSVVRERAYWRAKALQAEKRLKAALTVYVICFVLMLGCLFIMRGLL